MKKQSCFDTNKCQSHFTDIIDSMNNMKNYSNKNMKKNISLSKKKDKIYSKTKQHTLNMAFNFLNGEQSYYLYIPFTILLFLWKAKM